MGIGKWGFTQRIREKTAFTCESGLFQFKVLFRLTNAPSSFERLMEKVLAGLHFDICLIYLDDAIVKVRSLTVI